MRDCCERAWLACAIDSEGSVQVWRQTSAAVSTRAYGIRVVVNNSDDVYNARVFEILNKLGVRNWKVSRRTSKIGTKLVCEIKVAELESIIKLLSSVMKYMTSKKDFAEQALALALMRKHNKSVNGGRAPWTDAECDFAENIRRQFMPNSRANGETETIRSSAIPCQAEGNAISTSEGVETRTPSSISSNESHECPAPQQHLTVVGGEDIVRSTGKPVSGDKDLHEDIAVQ